jgi:hypothetical protein
LVKAAINSTNALSLHDLMASILKTQRSHLIFWPTTQEKITLSRKEKDIPVELPPEIKNLWKRKAKKMKMPLVCGGADKIKVFEEYLPAIKDKFAGVVFIDDQFGKLMDAADLTQHYQLLSHSYWVQRENIPPTTTGNISMISSLEDVGVLPDKALTTIGADLVNNNLTDGLLYAVGVNPPLSM